MNAGEDDPGEEFLMSGSRIYARARGLIAVAIVLAGVFGSQLAQPSKAAASTSTTSRAPVPASGPVTDAYATQASLGQDGPAAVAGSTSLGQDGPAAVAGPLGGASSKPSSAGFVGHQNAIDDPSWAPGTTVSKTDTD